MKEVSTPTTVTIHTPDAGDASYVTSVVVDNFNTNENQATFQTTNTQFAVTVPAKSSINVTFPKIGWKGTTSTAWTVSLANIPSDSMVISVAGYDKQPPAVWDEDL